MTSFVVASIATIPGVTLAAMRPLAEALESFVATMPAPSYVAGVGEHTVRIRVPGDYSVRPAEEAVDFTITVLDPEGHIAPPPILEPSSPDSVGFFAERAGTYRVVVQDGAAGAPFVIRREKREDDPHLAEYLDSSPEPILDNEVWLLALAGSSASAGLVFLVLHFLRPRHVVSGR